MEKEYLHIKDIETYLNQNINHISQFEVNGSIFIIHFKNGNTIEVEGQIDSHSLNYILSSYRD